MSYAWYRLALISLLSRCIRVGSTKIVGMVGQGIFVISLTGHFEQCCNFGFTQKLECEDSGAVSLLPQSSSRICMRPHRTGRMLPSVTSEWTVLTLGNRKLLISLTALLKLSFSFLTNALDQASSNGMQRLKPLQESSSLWRLRRSCWNVPKHVQPSHHARRKMAVGFNPQPSGYREKKTCDIYGSGTQIDRFQSRRERSELSFAAARALT